ncbi:hypothetical protein Q8F57_044880 [Paraburkholderia terrae]|uniref:hypothetical protein n=1 Tax=Paraburkholderia terrae TaxID=311230 RepID=UPI00296B024F|nr:hypothetical protein [Paraburkholderia terrae]MDW3663753.1 hypothetical protein [Paraburkholderia terrae]
MANPTRQFESFMDFGLGFDSATGNIRGLAVTRTPAAPVPGADGQMVRFHVHSVTTISEVKSALGVSADASFAGISGSGSASVEFAESSELHSYSCFLLVSSSVTNASTHMLDEKLITGPGSPAELIASGNLDRFHDAFGDLYIKGIETGGQFFAIIQIATSDSTDQTNVAASLSVTAFVGAGVGSLQSHFNSSAMSSLSTHHLDIFCLQNAGQGVSQQQFTTIDEMLTAATNFAETALKHPVAFRVELMDYVSLNLPPPPNAVDIQNAKDVLADSAARREAWLQFRNDIAFILQNPAQFNTPPVDLGALDSDGSRALNQISAAASTCLNNLSACRFVTNVPEPDRSKLPSRRSAIVVAPQRPPTIDGITAFALTAHSQLLPQWKTTPHSTPQAQSDVVLGISWKNAMEVAVVNNTIAAQQGVDPRVFTPNLSFDMASPIQAKMNEKRTQIPPNFAEGKFPDFTEQSAIEAMSELLLLGFALRQAMAELGEDVSKITFN